MTAPRSILVILVCAACGGAVPSGAPTDAAPPDAAPIDASDVPCFIDAAPDATLLPCGFGSFPCPFGHACNAEQLCQGVCNP